jgi:hypothetical protein
MNRVAKCEKLAVDLNPQGTQETKKRPLNSGRFQSKTKNL